MALKNIHMDSVLRGALETRADNLKGILEVAEAKAKELGLEGGNAVTAVAKHRRGPDKGQPKGSSNFNGRSLVGWIESIPAELPGAEDSRLEACANLLTLIATIKGRLK